MSDPAFNLLDENWIPVAGHDPVSLLAIFTNPALPALGGNARQKIALLKLFLAIAQAARTPATEEEWASLGPDGLGQACVAYLEKWRDRFYLHGPAPFLQMPVGKAEAESPGSLQPEIALGNNPRLTHIQCERSLTDADMALLLVTDMAMCLGGKRGDKSVSLALGHAKRTAPPGPGVGFMGYLHSFLTGASILETIWLNLLTLNDIGQLTWLPEGLGKPPWEEMPATELCPVAERLRGSLQGRLIPMARFCLLDDGKVRFTEGVQHKTHKEGVWDPSVAAMPSGKDFKMLWCDPEKRPWRSLSSLLSFLSAQGDKGFDCVQLKVAIPRLRFTPIRQFGIWSGGLRVSSNSGQQFISGSDDIVESDIQLDYHTMNNEEWFIRFTQEMERLENLARLLYGCVHGYLSDQGASDAKNGAARATGVFWEKAEEKLQDLLDACGDKDRLPDLKKNFFQLALGCYDECCPQNTARQLAAWAGHRPGAKRADSANGAKSAAKAAGKKAK